MCMSTVDGWVSFFLLHNKNRALCMVATVVAHTAKEEPAVTMAAIRLVGGEETLIPTMICTILSNVSEMLCIITR